MQPIIIWVLLLVVFMVETVLLYVTANLQASRRSKKSGLSIQVRSGIFNLILLLLLFASISFAIQGAIDPASQPAATPDLTLTTFLVFCIVFLVFLASLAIQDSLHSEEKCSQARQAARDNHLRKSWIWGGVINGLLLFGLGLMLTANLPVKAPVASGTFVNMLARPLTQVTLVLLALLGIYPLIYIAYRQVYSKVHQTRLGEDFQLLGIYTENEAQSKAEELYNIVYSNRQYMWFITLILLFSILILVVYGFIDQVKAVDLSRIGLDSTVRSLVFFAYLGAYVFSVQELVRRYNTEDLRPQVFSSILGRMLVATVVVYVAAHILMIIQPPEPSALTPAVTQAAVPATTAPEPGTAEGEAIPPTSESSEPGDDTETTPDSTTCAVTDPCSNPPSWWAAVLAFFIGTFPKSGIQWLQNLARNSINTLPAEVNALPVRNLQGISSLHEARLEEMGIDDVQNLATVDIRKLLMITRFDTQEIINWIDQAILYTKVGNKYERFREQGILTFHQLVHRLKPEISKGDPQAAKESPAAQEGADAPPDNETGEPADPQATQATQNVKLHELALSLNVTDDALKFLANEGDYPNYAFIKQYYLYTPQLARERASRGRSRLSVLRREGAPEEINVNERLLQERDESLAVLEQDPCNADALNNLGLTQFKLGETREDYLEAYQTLSKATAIDHNSSDKFANLAGVCVSLEDWDKVIQNATRAIELDQNNKVAHYYLGNAYAHKDFNAMAETKFYKALELDDHYGEVYVELGKLHHKLSAFQQAIDDFQVAYWLMSKRENIKFWLEWGTAYLDRGIEIEKGQPGQGSNCYAKAVEKLSEAIARKTDPKYFGLRGLANYKLSQFEPAIQDFERSLELMDEKALERIKYQYHLALAFWQAQKIEQACKMFAVLKQAAQPNSWYAVQADIYLMKTECAGAQPPDPRPVTTDQPAGPPEPGEGPAETKNEEPAGPAETQPNPSENT